jgi:dimethylamine monooxygenase subunit A
VTIPYVPLDAKGWRLSMGLRPLELTQWLEIDDSYESELTLKSQLLNEHYNDVVAIQPEGDVGSAELLAEVVHFLEQHTPHRDLVVRDDEPAIVAASRLVQEDLCVLVRDDEWRLRAACVCFPSRWELATKIGTTLDDIHAPVPHYDLELARPTNAFFDRLRPDRSFWRLNWTLLDNADLFQPGNKRSAPSGELDAWFFRVERQTLRQLPTSKTIVFTIRTYVASAATLRDNDEHFVATLLHALDTAPDSVQDYKGWRGVGERLRANL